MGTLTSATIRAWLKRQTSIIESCDALIDSDQPMPTAVWLLIRNARTEATILRDELLDLTVSAVEVTQ